MVPFTVVGTFRQIKSFTLERHEVGCYRARKFEEAHMSANAKIVAFAPDVIREAFAVCADKALSK